MVEPWIKIEIALKDDPRVRNMARELRNAYVTLGRYVGQKDEKADIPFFVTLSLGCLCRLWFYAYTYIRQDDTIDISIDDVDEIVGVESFSKIVTEDWLEILDAHAIKLPGFQDHNGIEARRKALTTRRVARHRENVALKSDKDESSSNVSNVTGALPEKIENRKDRDSKTVKAAAMRRPPNVSRASDPEWYLNFKLAFPNRGGDPNWRGGLRAANARLAEGHTVEEFMSGAERYAAYCEATDKVGTEFVQQASRFLGPAKPFLEPWALPATKADNRLRGNLSAADEFMRRTDPEAA